MSSKPSTTFGVEHEPGHPARSTFLSLSEPEDLLDVPDDGWEDVGDMTVRHGRLVPRMPWEVLL